jgi:hypothetical protein
VRFAVAGERRERLVDARGGLVAMEQVADLRSGEAAGAVCERGEDAGGEWVAGGVGERPGGAAGGVVGECERGVEVRGRDLGGAVDQRVEKRESDGVGLGARGDLAGDAGLGVGEARVGVVPEFAGGGVEAELAGGAGGLEVAGESGLVVGAVQGVGMAAVGEQSGAAAGDEQEAVEEAVGELDGVRVVAQLGCGDVADQADVRAAGAGRGGAREQRERAAVPGRAQDRGERVLVAVGLFEDAGELGLDDEQPPVCGAGVAAGGVRTAQTSPSPEDRPVVMRAARLGSASFRSRLTWSQEEPLRALAVSPTRTANSFGWCRVASI